MVVALEKELRFRTTDQLKTAWEGMCTDRKISQQDAANALLEWITRQDEMVQVMVLGQVPAREDLLETVLRRVSGEQWPPKGKVILPNPERAPEAKSSSRPAGKRG